jgi:hypothetical protein
MRRNCLVLIGFVAALGLVLGCESRTDKTDGGGVLLSVSDFDAPPVVVSVNSVSDPVNGGLIAIEEITIENVVKNPTGTTSDLMNVELQSYEVIFSRIDGGSRVPPPYTRGIFGVVPVNGTMTIDGLPVAGSEQFLNVPLSDLLVANGGVDSETGLTIVTCDLSLRFYGKTLSGKTVQTAPVHWSTEFRR